MLWKFHKVVLVWGVPASMRKIFNIPTASEYKIEKDSIKFDYNR